MKKTHCILTLAALILAVALASPVAAVTFTVPGCDVEEFAAVSGPRPGAKIEFEQGNLDVTGNALAMSETGLISLGSKNKIHGTVIAKKIKVATGAVIDRCIADTIEGAGTCTEVVPGGFAALPAACKTLPAFLDPIIVNPCVNSALKVEVAEGATASLPPGCYGLVVVKKFGTLNLQAGTYFILGLAVGLDATLTGVGPDLTRLLILRRVILGPLSNITDLSVATAETVGAGLSIDGHATLTRVRAVIAGGSAHVHTGTILEDSAVAAGGTLAVEPIQSRSASSPIVCLCPGSSVFAIPSCAGDLACQLARQCVVVP